MLIHRCLASPLKGNRSSRGARQGQSSLRLGHVASTSLAETRLRQFKVHLLSAHILLHLRPLEVSLDNALRSPILLIKDLTACFATNTEVAWNRLVELIQTVLVVELFGEDLVTLGIILRWILRYNSARFTFNWSKVVSGRTLPDSVHIDVLRPLWLIQELHTSCVEIGQPCLDENGVCVVSLEAKTVVCCIARLCVETEIVQMLFQMLLVVSCKVPVLLSSPVNDAQLTTLHNSDPCLSWVVST